MTGEKNRYSSVEKLWKLDDDTLKTPTHDEMVLYLLNEENLRKTVSLIDKFLDTKKRKRKAKSINDDVFFGSIENIWERIASRNTKITDKEMLLIGTKHEEICKKICVIKD